MVMRTAEPEPPFPGSDPDPSCAAPVHTLAPSFQCMPALPQSPLVNGWRKEKTGDSGSAAFAGSATPHTLAVSCQRIPALAQSALVSGWLKGLAANKVEAINDPLPNASIRANVFIAFFPIFAWQSAIAPCLPASSRHTYHPRIPWDRAFHLCVTFHRKSTFRCPRHRCRGSQHLWVSASEELRNRQPSPIKINVPTPKKRRDFLKFRLQRRWSFLSAGQFLWRSI